MKKETEIRNAIVEDVTIEIEDHGFLNVFLHLDYGNAKQSYGGYCLYNVYWLSKDEFRRDSTGLFICSVMDFFDVRNLMDIEGKSLRVEKEIRGRILRIGKFLSDEWLDMEEEFLKDEQKYNNNLKPNEYENKIHRKS